MKPTSRFDLRESRDRKPLPRALPAEGDFLPVIV